MWSESSELIVLVDTGHRHMITGQNLLLTGLRHGCTGEFVDYLIEENVSATEYDLRR